MSTPAPPQLADSLGYLLKHAHLQVAAMTDRALEPLGIDAKELGVLVVIASPEPPSQQQAAQRLGVDRTTMVALLDGLEAKGIVVRRPHATDRRRNVVELTVHGAEVFGSAVSARNAAERAYVAALAGGERRQLRRWLETVVASAEDPGQ